MQCPLFDVILRNWFGIRRQLTVSFVKTVKDKANKTLHYLNIKHIRHAIRLCGLRDLPSSLIKSNLL